MQLTLIKNTDELQSVAYKIARTVYAETHAVSLRVVEALTSMIYNSAVATHRCVVDVALDADLFPVLNPASPDNELLSVTSTDSGFQMCVRVARRMLHGLLPDCCNGATRFHHDGLIPDWATARGYIADIDGLLFYL